MGDGDGWTTCAQGHRHWGRQGAAGLLLRWRDPAGALHVLMQQRVGWSHEGGTWAVPGGARDSHEDDAACALREAEEEVGLDAAGVTLRSSWVDDHGGWRYTTVVGDAASRLPVRVRRETAAVRWVPADDVAALTLHSGFRAAWPHLRHLDPPAAPGTVRS